MSVEYRVRLIFATGGEHTTGVLTEWEAQRLTERCWRVRYVIETRTVSEWKADGPIKSNRAVVDAGDVQTVALETLDAETGALFGAPAALAHEPGVDGEQAAH